MASAALPWLQGISASLPYAVGQRSSDSQSTGSFANEALSGTFMALTSVWLQALLKEDDDALLMYQCSMCMQTGTAEATQGSCSEANVWLNRQHLSERLCESGHRGQPR